MTSALRVEPMTPTARKNLESDLQKAMSSKVTGTPASQQATVPPEQSEKPCPTGLKEFCEKAAAARKQAGKAAGKAKAKTKAACKGKAKATPKNKTKKSQDDTGENTQETDEGEDTVLYPTEEAEADEEQEEQDGDGDMEEGSEPQLDSDEEINKKDQTKKKPAPKKMKKPAAAKARVDLLPPVVTRTFEARTLNYPIPNFGP